MARISTALFHTAPRVRAGAPPGLWWAGALIGAAVLLPLVYLIYRTAGSGSDAWDLLARIQTLEVLLRTAALAAAVTGASILLSLPLAWLTVRTDLPFKRVWSVITVLPLVVPTYVGGYAFISAFGARGLVQQILEAPLGVTRLPDLTGFVGAWLVLTMFTYPYLLLTVRAALWGMDASTEEASRSLGHGPWRTFRSAILPQLKPAIGAGSLLVALYTLSDFGAVALLRFDSFTRVIFVQYEASFDRTLASVLALLLVASTVVVLLMERAARGRAAYHRSGGGAERVPSTVRLGSWKWPALAFVGGVVLVILGLPASVLLYWLAEGVAAGEELGFLGGAILNGLYVSGLAALVTVVAALPIGVLAVRFDGRKSRLLEGISYLGFAMPGLVVALALVFFGANFATPVYQTLWLLLFAYVVLFLPLALGGVRASLLQISPALEEAARSLGRSWSRTMVSVTLPLLRPGLVVAAALVFLTVLKELPATLLLAPIGFDTLATEMWAAADEGFFARAAAPGLILIAVSIIPVAVLLSRERGAQITEG